MKEYLFKSNTQSGLIFHNLQNEVIHHNYYLKSYRLIFNNDDIENIQKISPQFFSNLHKMYLDSMILCISRLFDKSENKLRNGEVQNNLSFKHLVASLKKDQFSDDKVSNFENELNSIENEISLNILKYRHKFIGHTDKDLLLDPDEDIEKIKCFLLVDVEEAIRKINNLTNSITEFFIIEIPDIENKKEISHDYKIAFENVNSDVNKLMEQLKKAL